MDISADVLQTVRQSTCRDCNDLKPWQTCGSEETCQAFKDECQEMQIAALVADCAEGRAREEAGV